MSIPSYITSGVAEPDNFVLGVLDQSGRTLRDAMNEAAEAGTPFILFTDGVGLADDTASPVAESDVHEHIKTDGMGLTADYILDGRSGTWQPKTFAQLRAEF